jgi:glycerol transport system permease protein
MSFKTTNEILGLHAVPAELHAGQLRVDLHRSDLVLGLYQLADLCLDQHGDLGLRRLPAAYAFSRYRFLGDKHLFFWLLTNRMAPAAVFALPFFQLYSAVGLFDTHLAVALAHCLFNIPLAVWILEGFMSGVPKELDETAYIDGYSFPALLRQDLPAHHRRRHRRGRVLLLHVLLGRTAAGQDPDRGRGQTDRRNHDPNGARPSGYELGLLAAAGTLTDHARAPS